MTETELKRIENELGVHLPKEYVQVMIKYPFSSEHFGAKMMIDDVDQLIKHNARNQQSRSKGKKLPSTKTDHFWIGSDEGELSFIIKLGGDSTSVLYFSLECGQLKKFCDNLNVFVEKCHRIDRDEEALPEEDSNIPEAAKWVYSVLILAGLVLFGFGIFKLAVGFLRPSGLGKK